LVEAATGIKVDAQDGAVARIVSLMLATGMHSAVLADPKRHEVEVSRGALTWLRPKTVKRCFWDIPENDGRGWLSGRALVDAVFRQDEMGRPTGDAGRTTRTYHRWITLAAKAAGLEDVSPLTLRHTAAVLMLQRTRDPVKVQETMRAGDAVLWRHYLKLVPNRELEIVMGGDL
jgi:integrase